MSELSSPEKLSLLCDMSEELLIAAQQGDWEKVDTIDKQRLAILPDFSGYAFAQDEEVSIVQQKIERILEINRRVVELGSAARQQHLQDNRKFAKGRQAVNLYNSFA